LLTFWDPSVALHENPQLALILDFYWLALQLMRHVVLHVTCWNKLHMGQNGTDGHKIPKLLLRQTFVIFRGGQSGEIIIHSV